MPPVLDLSRTAHSKMIVSPPRINLRKAASYNHDRGPLSSTSSRFNFNHLVFSPPPSPVLPSLSPPPKKSPKGFAGFARPSRIIRYTLFLLVGLVGFTVVKYLFGLVSLVLNNNSKRPGVLWSEYTSSGYKAMEREDLPKTITPMMFLDRNGKRAWTVFVPGGRKSPPSAHELSMACAKCSHSLGGGNHGAHFRDHEFIDVREAQEGGYLSGITKEQLGDDVAAKLLPPCEKSLTLVLDSTSAGLGNTLMMLWTAYGVAKDEGRAFFIDDSQWAYGKYSDMFQPLPDPLCAPPPRREMIPCPRQARHLIASSASNVGVFSTVRTSTRNPSSSTLRNSFELARVGHDALFHLTADDASYVDQRTRELLARRIPPKTKGMSPGLAVGVHIRRGDLHPFELQYQYNYIPLQIYADAARSLIDTTLSGPSAPVAKKHSFTILASDDPTVYDAAELPNSIPAQDRIKLASKQPKEVAPPDRKFMRKFVDENVGWEGGFYTTMFWNLGSPNQDLKTGAWSHGTPRTNPPKETLRLRSLVGRAYLMDLAVLADASDHIVCAASAAGCRLLAVMMGWEEAMEKGRWVNIDKGASWGGIEGAVRKGPVDSREN
ncbi:hypothetical protein QBC34DRAFT_52637 [Podospora aff. communis PSN243]|uniref:Uncharacterized protein n=1 Tax=Podospora aff. communis PSN243 TaxID=3040156 RepID=A0AAV9GWE9_9PEZI|nr:hypothetical protein QBC34DRAFT_52637 [Podospora aff. communis PSN243]